MWVTRNGARKKKSSVVIWEGSRSALWICAPSDIDKYCALVFSQHQDPFYETRLKNLVCSCCLCLPRERQLLFFLSREGFILGDDTSWKPLQNIVSLVTGAEISILKRNLCHIKLRLQWVGEDNLRKKKCSELLKVVPGVHARCPKLCGTCFIFQTVVCPGKPRRPHLSYIYFTLLPE